MSKNQIGRELLRRLVEETGCDMQVAIRFFYNSDFYAQLPEGNVDVSLDDMFVQLKREFEQG